MSTWKLKSAVLLCLAALALSGADKFQVTCLPGPSEPKLRQAVSLDHLTGLFAKRLSQTLKQEVKVVPFEKADAETIFLITREAALGGEYAKVLAGKPKDSFIVRYPVTIKGKKNVCLLMGRDAWSYAYPGYHFLRKYLGVDIVLPGEYGLVCPDNSKWQMPKKIDIKESPDFNTRTWTMNRVVDKEFARMQLAESRRNISWHAFGRIISPKKYGKKHPEYFPLVRGVRRNNPSKDRCDWSPCVSNPEVQKLFVDYLLKHFEANNYGSEAVELSVNDGSGNHCECSGCTAWDDPGEKEKGHYSNRYFTFYDKVMTAATKVNPDVKACVLLYSDATSLVPAKVKFHPALVGMSTKETTIRNFAKHGMKRLGLWEHQLDYLYPLPRHYPQAMAAKLREMHQIGVREYFGEVYMFAAANAPKQYILGRLLWDLDTDPVKVLEEYCLKAYGPEAAPYLKKYYDTWEKVYTRECVARKHIGKLRVHTYGPEWFVGVRKEDVKAIKEALAKAEKSKMTAIQRERFNIVKNHYAYISCLVENYLDALDLRNSKNLSLEEINKIHERCKARDAVFADLWKRIISKDKWGYYRRIKAENSRKKGTDNVYHLFRNSMNAYVIESVEAALKNHQTQSCASMKKADRLAYWQKAFKKYPKLMAIAVLIGENSSKALVNHLENGNFKIGVPGNPAVKGGCPKVKNWYFYDEIGDVLADDYKNYWKLVQTKGASNELGFGMGKYPEVRTFMYLTAGTYRFSFTYRGVNGIYFNMYRVPTLTKEGFKDVMTLRSHKVRTPAVFSLRHTPSTTEAQKVSRIVVVETSCWYSMLVATPSKTNGPWDYLMDVKMEKLIP